MSNKESNLPEQRLRVLMADDSAAIRDSLSALISRLPGIEIVGAATTGLEALDLIRKLKPDVATLDVRMPEMNGISVLEVIKKERLGVTVIVLTGAAEVEYKLKCLELGARFFFHKSTEFEKVIEVLSDYVLRLNDPEAKIRHLP